MQLIQHEHCYPKLLLSSRALPEAWQQAIIPAVYMPTTAPPRQFCSSDSRCNKPVFLEDLLPFCPALSFPWLHHCFTAKLANRLTANLWPMFAAISDQRPSSCHRTSYTCRNRTAPRRISPPYSGSRKAVQDAKPRKVMQHMEEERRKGDSCPQK